ncbi:hypothetical protein BO70DRAFT_382601 [Aspergillus heteromorphus CBS 117.55]|uniref:Ubiquitin 3 binding protein But2 C-terminal domain-containing protein n=1 Tax=Aspergillus heteromorphus CBS 117.55 TaxID=1448321 RepID=A0A317V450_9EURO|nr:uncharacterized protein BO70DRAFT_382601 [Aspergillus heteromorphus CBS 117.55]PWY69054.1 hypothetical protein BO70DRAFT_382601 [Aspergillus heteromorphus CBS 117.55]
MKTTIPAAFAALASLVVATPTPAAPLVARACTTIAPTIIDVLDSSTPNTARPGEDLSLARSASANTRVSAFTFNNIPAGATGCMLEIDIPVLTENNEIAEGSSQADIWTTSPWDSSSLPTWNNQPTLQAMVSTFIFPTGQTSSPFHTVLASNSCSSTMSFLARLSTWQTTEGHVDFQNSIGGSQPIGWSLVFNC